MADNYVWNKPATSTLKFSVALSENGNIAGEGEDAAGSKVFALPGIKSDSTFAQADTAYNEIYGKIAGMRYDKNSGTLTTVYTVKEEGE